MTFFWKKHDAAQPSPKREATTTKLRRPDFIILPLVAVATLLILVPGSEAAARLLWPEHQKDACLKADGSGFIPDCTSRVKIAEGPWVTYHYNGCGLRSDKPCGPKAAGTERVAVIGTSISTGYWVPYAKVFSGRLERGLSRDCGSNVEFQTEPMTGLLGKRVGVPFARLDQWVPKALALKPDALVTVVAPFDLQEYRSDAVAAAHAGAPQSALHRVETFLQHAMEGSRAMHMTLHFLDLSQTRYAASYLRDGDATDSHAGDFMRTPFTPAWRARLAFADRVFGLIAAQAHSAGVPFIIAFMPNRAEAALSASPEPGADAFALPKALAAVARRHGAIFVDVTAITRRIKQQDNLFYRVDGHPTAAGHALIAQALKPALEAAVPGLGQCKSVSPANS